MLSPPHCHHHPQTTSLSRSFLTAKPLQRLPSPSREQPRSFTWAPSPARPPCLISCAANTTASLTLIGCPSAQPVCSPSLFTLSLPLGMPILCSANLPWLTLPQPTPRPGYVPLSHVALREGIWINSPVNCEVPGVRGYVLAIFVSPASAQLPELALNEDWLGWSV